MAVWDVNIPIDRARMFVGGEPLSGEIQLDIMKKWVNLRPHDELLEVGSGAGHLAYQAAQYLNPGHYYGIEPNQWTMEEFKKFDPNVAKVLEETGAHFDSNDQLDFSVFGDTAFDVIFSHSILSHASVDQLDTYFAGIKKYLKSDGAALASLHYDLENNCEESSEWVYPDITWFKWETLENIAKKYNLVVIARPEIKEYYMSRREDDWHNWIEVFHSE